jgi:hypothetical protein
VQKDYSPTVAPARPIAFSTAMVRAILDGRKTQTRRAVKPQPKKGSPIPPSACPLGAVGELLWVRERCAQRPANPTNRAAADILYAADVVGEIPAGVKWRSSRYMPRRHSRILLQITGVRCERLRRITSEDARREGFHSTDELADPLQWFHMLWNSLTIDPALSWRANPWVWVIEFDVVRPSRLECQRILGTTHRRSI